MRLLINFLITFMMVYSVTAADSRDPGDIRFVAIDLTSVEIPGSRGFEPTPFIVGYDVIMDDYRTWIMTIDDETGMQLGQRLEISLPPDHIPVDILWSRHLEISSARGVEPTPFHLFQDFYIFAYPVSRNPDGTPASGSPVAFPPAVTPDVYGYALCMTEMPATEFTDGLARLCIGTDRGYVIVLMSTFPGELLYDRVLSLSDVPVLDLEPIPQFGYIALGALTDNMIYGLDINSEKAGGQEAANWTQMFILHDPRLTSLTDFDIFDAKDAQIPEPGQTVRMILADGTSNLALASISAQQSNSETLEIVIDSRLDNVRSIAAGSLLLLPADSSKAIYDPWYSGEYGSSGCDVDITDSINDGCAYDPLCGDANSDQMVDIADPVYLINYIFKSGPAPDPLCTGDASGDGTVDIGDAVHLINYIFKGGPAPAADCCF
jgi:hypothetical protein